MKRVILILTALLIIACNSNQNKSKDDVSTKITLNNGEKWVVNSEMKQFIEKANDILNTYVSSKSTDYKTLAEQLKAQNNNLIKSCTMKGKGHNELHNWLMPHTQLINELDRKSK